MSQEDLLRKLEAELETLRFESFNFSDALAIGLDLVETGRRKVLPIAIDVTVNQQQLFHAALPGSSPDNDQWVLRKSKVAARFFKSSLAIATDLRIKGKTIEEVWGLPSAEYAPFGGSFPVQVNGSGVIGTITVSGLPDAEDHETVVTAIRRHVERKG
jgi:uncharacterized protein (UPF0303 family)